MTTVTFCQYCGPGVKALLAEVEELRRDKARLDWLDNDFQEVNLSWVSKNGDEKYMIADWHAPLMGFSATRHTLRKGIDAKMEAEDHG